MRLNLSEGALPWAICIDPFIAVYLFLHLFFYLVCACACVCTYTIMCIGCLEDNFTGVYFILSCSCTWDQVPDWAFIFRQGLTNLPSVSLNSFCSTDRHLTCNLPLNLTLWNSWKYRPELRDQEIKLVMYMLLVTSFWFYLS